MNILETKSLSYDQVTQINNLWNSEYPVKLANRFLNLLDGVENYMHFIVDDGHGLVLAWAVYFFKDGETRFSIIVHPKHAGKGLGTFLVDKLKNNLDIFYGWVIDHDNDKKSNGERYRSPLSFYTKRGFTILSENRIDTEMLSAVKVKWSRQ